VAKPAKVLAVKEQFSTVDSTPTPQTALTPPPEVQGGNVREIESLPAFALQSVQEVDLLAVHDILFVETANAKKRFPPNQQAGTADPVDGLRS
jgi:hypothetical protein